MGIEPRSASPIGLLPTPLAPVPKKDGGVRICDDYKPTVNTQIEEAHHPLSTVKLITSKLSGNTVFSKIDLN